MIVRIFDIAITGQRKSSRASLRTSRSPINKLRYRGHLRVADMGGEHIRRRYIPLQFKQSEGAGGTLTPGRDGVMRCANLTNDSKGTLPGACAGMRVVCAHSLRRGFVMEGDATRTSDTLLRVPSCRIAGTDDQIWNQICFLPKEHFFGQGQTVPQGYSKQVFW